MNLSWEETQLLLTGTCLLENEYRKKENDSHGQPVTEYRKRNRAKLKAIKAIQGRLIERKSLLEKAQ